MNIRISIATNDEHGNDTGRVTAVEIGGALDLKWGVFPDSTAPKYSLGNGQIKISRKTFPIIASKEWYGNWCWTGITVTPAVAADILNYLAQDDRWHCEGGWCELCDLYAARKVSAEWLERNAEELVS